MRTLDIFEQIAETGHAPKFGCHLFGVGYDDAIERLRQKYLEERFERGKSAEKFVVGTFGSGKTHFLRHLAEIARDVLRDLDQFLELVDQAAHQRIELGHVLFGPRLARTRAATEAVFLIARHAFEELGYRRFEWKCDALNASSRRAALRYGFVFEGLFRRDMIIRKFVKAKRAEQTA